MRFDRFVSIAEAANSAAASCPHPTATIGFKPGPSYCLPQRSRAASKCCSASRKQSQVSHTAEDQISQAAGRLDKWLDNGRNNLTVSNDEQVSPPATPADFSMASLLTTPGAGEWTHYVAEGGNDRLDLQLRAIAPTPSQVPFIGLLLIISMLIATIYLMHGPQRRTSSAAGRMHLESCSASPIGRGCGPVGSVF